MSIHGLGVGMGVGNHVAPISRVSGLGFRLGFN